jgi:hypothetical protein
MSDPVARFHGQVAAFEKHGAAPEVLMAARRRLAAAKLRKAADAERGRLGLPPLAEDLAGVMAAVALREAA